MASTRQDKGVTFAGSGRKDKKYVATLPDGKKVHFGDKRYPQYKDQTPVKAYKHLDHGDPARRENYFSRHGREAKKHSPKDFSHRYLW
jgi:hypothetical protein